MQDSQYNQQGSVLSKCKTARRTGKGFILSRCKTASATSKGLCSDARQPVQSARVYLEQVQDSQYNRSSPDPTHMPEMKREKRQLLPCEQRLKSHCILTPVIGFLPLIGGTLRSNQTLAGSLAALAPPS
ncbi:unnamed protein product [Arctogadus glacialis]